MSDLRNKVQEILTDPTVLEYVGQRRIKALLDYVDCLEARVSALEKVAEAAHSLHISLHKEMVNASNNNPDNWVNRKGESWSVLFIQRERALKEALKGAGMSDYTFPVHPCESVQEGE